MFRRCYCNDTKVGFPTHLRSEVQFRSASEQRRGEGPTRELLPNASGEVGQACPSSCPSSAACCYLRNYNFQTEGCLKLQFRSAFELRKGEGPTRELLLNASGEVGPACPSCRPSSAARCADLQSTQIGEAIFANPTIRRVLIHDFAL